MRNNLDRRYPRRFAPSRTYPQPYEETRRTYEHASKNDGHIVRELHRLWRPLLRKQRTILCEDRDTGTTSGRKRHYISTSGNLPPKKDMDFPALRDPLKLPQT